MSAKTVMNIQMTIAQNQTMTIHNTTSQNDVRNIEFIYVLLKLAQSRLLVPRLSELLD
jgi:hypothetical protein